jgi:hypothetical protein
LSDESQAAEREPPSDPPHPKASWAPPTLRRMNALDAQAKTEIGVELHAHLVS